MLTVANNRNFPKLSSNDDVIVVSLLLSGSKTAMKKMEECLSPEEMARASRYRFDKDRRAFIAGRALLRICLAHYLGGNPRSVTFEYSSEGKPQLSSAHVVQVHFNLSHTEGLAAVAISRGGRLGIDVEQTARGVDELEIAEKYFSTAETERLRALSEGERRLAFLDYWVRKEAYAKATGRGLSDVLERPHKHQNDDPCFTFLPLSFEGDYVGVVAAEGDAHLAEHIHFASLDDLVAVT